MAVNVLVASPFGMFVNWTMALVYAAAVGLMVHFTQYLCGVSDWSRRPTRVAATPSMVMLVGRVFRFGGGLGVSEVDSSR